MGKGNGCGRGRGHEPGKQKPDRRQTGPEGIVRERKNVRAERIGKRGKDR